MTRIHTAFAVAAIGGAGLYAACSKTTPEPDKVAAESPSTAAIARVHSAPSTESAPGASAAKSAGPEDVAWDAPAAWTSMPNPNTMRKATYKVPRAPGDTEDAELTVSAASGGVEPNIKRWAGQFGNAEPKTESRKVNGLDVTIVEIKGTYASGGMIGPATPKEKYMLLGAVVDGGDRQHFFKMTGPEKTVTAARKDFESLVSSLRAK
jgi:hypothetical protein